jgi:hypothetical protein
MNFEEFYASIESDIKAVIKAKFEAENKPETWNPKGGEWTIDITGEVFTGATDRESRDFGTERATRELAQAASEKMRVFNRLMAYVDEVSGGWEFTVGCDNAYISYDIEDNEYLVSYEKSEFKGLGTVYMHIDTAHMLCKKLNSGEVVL